VVPTPFETHQQHNPTHRQQRTDPYNPNHKRNPHHRHRHTPTRQKTPNPHPHRSSTRQI
jgi:hypothetical protein